MRCIQSIKLKMTEQGMGNDGAGNGRKWVVCTKEAEWGWEERVVCTKESERRIGGGRLVVPWQRSGGWEVSERMYGAVGENSIEFLKILYRLFPDTSVQPLGQHRSNDWFVREERCISSVEKSASVRRRGSASCVGLWRKVRRGGGQRVVGCGRFAWQKRIDLLFLLSLWQRPKQMIAVGSDRGTGNGTIYIEGSSPSCLGLFFVGRITIRLRF